MNLFKAIVMCEDCGEIHAEKWLTSSNRHATTTTLFVLCDSCKENELRLTEDDYFDEVPTCSECGNKVNKHYDNCSQFDPFASHDVCFLCIKPWSQCKCFKEENKSEHNPNCECETCLDPFDHSQYPDFDPFATELAPTGVHCEDCKRPFEREHSDHHIDYGDTKYCSCLPF